MFKFSKHARERNVKRKIPNKQILETVRKPDSEVESFKGRRLRRKKFGDKILEVVTITEGNKITIVTQYYLGGNNEN